MVNRRRRQDQIQSPVFTGGQMRVSPSLISPEIMLKSEPGGDLVPRIMGKTPAPTLFFVPGYIPQFDGLRGLAILLVLIGHSGFLEALPHAAMLEYTRFGVD